MTVQMSPYYPENPPYKAGDRVRLKDVFNWKIGPDDGARPILCCYVCRDPATPAGMPHPVRELEWPAALDDLAGREFQVTRLSAVNGLPIITEPNGAAWWVHPDWLERVGVAVNPLGPECSCDSMMLMRVGCKCGRIQRERKTRAA